MQKRLIHGALVCGALTLASVLPSTQVQALPPEEALAGAAAGVAAGTGTDVVLRVSDETGAQTRAANGTGTAQPEHLGDNSHFRIGSVTKTFVATVVLQLVDEGRIALDGSIADQLREAVPGGDQISVRQLLNHTSGLYDYMKEPGMSTNRWRGADRFTDYRPSQLLGAAFRHEPYFAPGTDFRYSNTNYIVLGMLIEQVTGQRYGDEVTRRILTPLGLSQTSFPGTGAGIPAPAIRAEHTLDDGTTVDVTEMNPSLDWSAGEMISTTHDLDVFLGALLAGHLTSPAMLAEMTRTVPMGSGFHYGLGIQRFDPPCGGPLWGHGGELLGYLTYAFRSDTGRAMTMAIASATASAADLPTLYGPVTATFCLG